MYHAMPVLYSALWTNTVRHGAVMQRTVILLLASADHKIRMNHDNNHCDNSKRSPSPLSLTTEQQLVTDIVEAGGLAQANLISICNLRPEIYGKKGTQLRRKVQNRVAYYKRPSSGNLFDRLVSELPVGNLNADVDLHASAAQH